MIDAGDGGGGDGSSGSEESGNDGGVSTIPLPTPCVQTTYDALRGLGIVGSHAVGEDDDQDQPGSRRSSLPRRAEVIFTPSNVVLLGNSSSSEDH